MSAKNEQFTCYAVPHDRAERECTSGYELPDCKGAACFKQDSAFCSATTYQGTSFYICSASREECESWRPKRETAARAAHEPGDQGPCLLMNANDPAFLQGDPASRIDKKAQP